jgi:hypothetical protein
MDEFRKMFHIGSRRAGKSHRMRDLREFTANAPDDARLSIYPASSGDGFILRVAWEENKGESPACKTCKGSGEMPADHPFRLSESYTHNHGWVCPTCGGHGVAA